MFRKKQPRKFQWWDVPEGYTVILRRGYSVIAIHPSRKALCDEAFRVLDPMEAALERKEGRA